MSRAFSGLAPRLEVMDADQGGQVLFLTRAQFDQARHEAFEQGYHSGQNDCLAASRQGQEQRVAAAVQNLADAVFSYREARQAVLRALRPLVEAMVGHVLPQLAERALPALVAEKALELADETTDRPLRLLCAPGTAERLVVALTEAGLPADSFVVVPDADCASLACRIALHDGALNIDIEGALARLREAVAAFHDDMTRENING